MNIVEHAPILILIVPLGAALCLPLLALMGRHAGAATRVLTLLGVSGSLVFSIACLWRSIGDGVLHYHLARKRRMKASD